jgi:ribosomal protein S18 acetylase RimI-like enzyme
MSELTIRQVNFADLDRCAEIEAACYGPEGATKERIATRIQVYSQGFLVALLDGQIVGFINSGSTSKDDLSNEALKDMVGHEPEGQNIVIFSLAVHPLFQKRGFAAGLMRRFIDRARQLGKAQILLMCQAELIPYYQRFGFIYRNESQSTHGNLHWHELALPLMPNKV